MTSHLNFAAALTALLLFHVCPSSARSEPIACSVRARIDAGWVCGLRRWGEDGAVYASFRGVPYAKQPLGELRFQELQPAEPWDYLYDASEEGPICPQKDVLYGRIMQPQGMSEACIHANIHVPIEALPGYNQGRPVRELQLPHDAGYEDEDERMNTTGLPVFVFVHGGGFAFGSGDADMHGPEYLVSKGVIVITFNYRLNVFGFLSLNSSSIPGNAGLRDMVTLLRWVQRNARNFGGDPDDVTLGGQSAGAVSAHLLSLSSVTEGLFKRVILMSGSAIRSFYSYSPIFAQYMANQLLVNLGINSTDPEDIHRQLIDVPLEKIMEVNSLLIDQIGVSTFVPVVESSFPGVTAIVEDDPEVLIANGRGKDLPFIIGFANNECEVFRKRFEEINIVSRLEKNSLLLVPPSLVYSIPPEVGLTLAKKIEQRYFNGTPTLDKFVSFCSNAYFKYPATKVAELRTVHDAAPVFLYQFAYQSERSVLQEGIGLKYKGAAHIEDLTYIFRVNSVLGTHSSFPPRNLDDMMKDWLTKFFVNFMYCSDPTCNVNIVSGWPPVNKDELKYQDIETPKFFHFTEPSKKEQEMVQFYDSLQNGNS